MVHMAPTGKDLKGLNGFKLVNKKRSKLGNMGSNGSKWVHMDP